MEITTHSIFPCPGAIVKRDSKFTSKENKEVKDIINEGLFSNSGNSHSTNTNIFNGKLKKLKQFCEQHLDTYIKEVICPKEDLNFYITQSWLNINKPGEFHHEHSHSNSIISGVFYVSTEEDDKIFFTDPNQKLKDLLRSEVTTFNLWNSSSWFFPAVTNELLIFPSWLNHRVDQNEKATKNRISISFNTFVTGVMGSKERLTELILK